MECFWILTILILLWEICMKHIKPMTKIKIILCAFGIFIGIIFPIYASFFVEWIPKRKILFDIGCLIAGYLVGLFSFYIVKIILQNIDSQYRKILSENLGIESSNGLGSSTDLLLNMKNEFKKLIKNYSILVRHESENLRMISITDCLTSGYNHRYLYEYFSKKIQAGYSEMALMFCDIDFFKKVNDTYGHIVGDLVLKKVGTIIKAAINENGDYFRYGGEEFVVILNNCSSYVAYETAEKIRINIENSNEIQQYCKFEAVTISIGLSSYPFDGLKVESLIEKSDKAMYFAKQNGRNRCELYKDYM